MLLRSYRLEIVRPGCNPGFTSLHCIAHLDQDIAAVLPYLNAALGGHGYTLNPPAVHFKSHGRLIAVHPDRIAINALESRDQAERLVAWMQAEINACWERRDEITPCTSAPPRPSVVELIKALPRTNCAGCGQPTCLVFATLLAQGAKRPADCPPLGAEAAAKLSGYLAEFRLDG